MQRMVAHSGERGSMYGEGLHCLVRARADIEHMDVGAVEVCNGQLGMCITSLQYIHESQRSHAGHSQIEDHSST